MAELRIARERDAMQAERDEMQIRVGMIERAYKRDMKHLERIRSELNIKNSYILNQVDKSRQKSSEIESRNKLFDKALEASGRCHGPNKATESSKDGVKMPGYSKIATRKKKGGILSNKHHNSDKKHKAPSASSKEAKPRLSTSPSSS